MPQFQPLDLSSVYQNAEALRAMQSNTLTDQLQREYMRGTQIPNAQAANTRAQAQEGRAAQTHASEQNIVALRTLNAAAAEIAANPQAAQRWMPQLKAAGIPIEQLGPLDQATAKQLFDSTSQALQAYNAGSGVTQAKPSALIEQYDRYVAQGGKLPFVDPNRSGNDFITQFSQSQVGAQYNAPVNQPGVGVVQPSRVDPARNVTLAPEADVSAAAAQRAGAEAGATTTGKTVAERKIDLPRLEQNASQSIKIIDDLKKHPGLPFITGLYSKAPILPGTNQAAADALAKQIQGTTFLEAYNTLKGGGQITEIEGTKAQEAIGRLSRAQSTEDYIGALDDLRSVISNGLERARQTAGGGVGAQGNAPKQIQSDEEYNALPSGAQYIAPDGSTRTKR